MEGRHGSVAAFFLGITGLINFNDIYELVHPYTMTDAVRMRALANAVVNTAYQGGCFVECGVWRGGSVMLIAATLMQLGITDRDIYLYDTFEGMSVPSGHDITSDGELAQDIIDNPRFHDKVMCVADEVEVLGNLRQARYPMELFKVVKGDVLKTIPETLPSNISVLHLDTDWYESTKHELTWLWPRVQANGIVIIDDYGFWQGCRKAVDEWIAEQHINGPLEEIDFTARRIVKHYA
jgi:hypothetical protein